jgi:acyl dehydratase
MSQSSCTVAELHSLTGQALAPTPWIVIDQARVNAFAACTDDHQFIHVDPERATRESPFGGTIAHGFLTLSMIGGHQPADFPAVSDLRLVVNYGLNSVRFMNPVRTGSRVRVNTRILSVANKGPGRVLLKLEKTMEVEGEARPAYVAEQLLLYVSQSAT